ncbi:MAG: alpha/beta hydrolase [Phycisphaeraceae bacterium]|nr:alpha/beta hydrolase [Phycisphaeraceae bacterium]
MPSEHRVLLEVPVARVPTANGQRELVADLYLPRSDRPTPLVMYVHGGGWKQGTQYRPPFAPRLFDEGIAVAATTYRFSGEAPFPACLHDCKTMLRWLRAHASTYNFDAGRIVVWGISAGGHLVSLMGLTADQPQWEGDGPHHDQSTAVTAVVNWCGPTDFVRAATDPNPGVGIHPLVTALIGGPYEERMDVARAASPVYHVHPQAPPHLLVFGRLDEQVPLWNGQSYHQKLTEAGVQSELVINDEAGHALGQELEVQATARFIRRHLLKT